MTRTMPATFEGVEAALIEEEAARVLSNLKDPHATRATTTPSGGTPVTCTTCGSHFLPKKTVHVRCDACHKKHVEEKKKKRDQKSGQSPGEARAARGQSRSAHDTEVLRGGEGDDEDLGTPAWASYATMVHAMGTELDDDEYIIFDPAANSHVIKDARLALNLDNNGPVIRVKGSVPGCVEVRSHGSLGDLGPGPVSPSFTRTLISEAGALAAGYHVIHDTRISNEYRLIKDGCPPLIFKLNKHGTYSIPTRNFLDHFSNSYDAASHSTDVDRTQVTFTKSQRDRAELYMRHHATVFAHAHDDKIMVALENGSLVDAPYTAADVRNAAIIHGPCTECLRAKGTKHRKTGHYPRRPNSPGELLTGDLFYIMGVAFFMLTCRMVNLRIVIRLKNKSASQIMAATGTALGIWKGFGATPKLITWDQEPAMVACAHEIWAKHGVKLEFTPPDGHEKVAERNVRTIKEHVFASILSLGHAIDDVMLEGIVRDTVTMLNFLPTVEVDRSAPRTILDGERLNVRRWSRFTAGQVGEFEIPYPDQSAGARKELGYILCHQGDNAVVRLLPSGRRAVVRSPHFTPLHKSSAIVKMIEEGISGAHRQSFNDLIADIGDQLPQLPAQLPASTEIKTSEKTTHDPTDADTQDEGDDITFFGSPPMQEAQEQLPEGPTTNVPTEAPLTAPTVEEASQEAVEAHEPEITQPETPPIRTVTVAPRRSQRAAAQKPKGFYAQSTSSESVQD